MLISKKDRLNAWSFPDGWQQTEAIPAYGVAGEGRRNLAIKRNQGPKNCLTHPRAVAVAFPHQHSPRKTPLATPGIPWISVTLFCTKYSSQVALKLEPLQKRRQSAVVTVPLPTTCILAQVSKLRFASVRFPRRQTLEQERVEFVFTTLLR